MNIIVSVIISALMVLGSMAYTHEKAPSLGASQPISSLTAKTTLQGDDTMVIVDNSGTPTTKKITVTNATTSMKGYNDLTYSPIFSTSAGLAALLSDETGSGGGFVRATSPTISGAVLTSSPALTTPSFDVAGTDATGDIYYNGGSGVLTRLGIGGGTSYYLRTSAGGIPEWDNSVATFPYQASSTFMATTTWQAGVFTIGANLFSSTTAGETITAGKPVTMSTSTGRILLADANDVLRLENIYGIAVQGGTVGQPVLVQTAGVVSGMSGLTAGMPYYVQDAVGTLGTTIGTYEAKVGIAQSSTELLIQRGSNEYVGNVTAMTDRSCGTTSCTASTTAPYFANKAIVSVKCTQTNNQHSAEGIVQRGGSSLVLYRTTDSGPAYTEITASFTASNGSVNVGITGGSGTTWTCANSTADYLK